MRELFLVGRIIAGAFFLMNGVKHFTNLEQLARGAAAQGVPFARLAVALAGVLLLVGGLSLLLGLAPRIGIAALLLFLVPVTFTMHQFWDMPAGRRAVEEVNFFKNLGLIGMLLTALAIPLPWPYSAGSRVRVRRRLPV
jgi:putative oxidoreductase